MHKYDNEEECLQIILDNSIESYDIVKLSSSQFSTISDKEVFGLRYLLKNHPILIEESIKFTEFINFINYEASDEDNKTALIEKNIKESKKVSSDVFREIFSVQDLDDNEIDDISFSLSMAFLKRQPVSN